MISKKRYVIPISDPKFDMTQLSSAKNSIDQISLSVELDIFDPPFAPLVIAEVEFPDEKTAEAFLPLDWFSQDVTNDPAYHNSNLSRRKL